MAGLHRGLQAGAMVEGKQHVIDRRAIGHGFKGLAWRMTIAVIPRNDTPLNSLPVAALRQSAPGRHRRLAKTPNGRSPSSPGRTRVSTGISASSLLKELDCLYRPAGPNESFGEGACHPVFRPLGRRQVVRQWIL